MTGLDDVIAAETVLSDVDGANGRLIIRGVPVEELARTSTFEGAALILFAGFFADLPDEAGFALALGRAREEAFRRLAPQLSALAALPPVEALRAGLALLPDGDDFDTALRLTAASAVLTAAIVRAGRAAGPVAPDARLGHAADLLRMVNGVGPTKAAERTLNAYLATVAE